MARDAVQSVQVQSGDGLLGLCLRGLLQSRWTRGGRGCEVVGCALMAEGEGAGICIGKTYTLDAENKHPPEHACNMM